MIDNFYIGCSGWSYREWSGRFYPLDLKPSHHFHFYTTHFNTVEINSTFHQFPSSKTLLKWYHVAPQEFKYTFKANRIITHILKFNEVSEWIKKTYSLSDIFQEKMGCFLFQLPPSFIFTPQNLDLVLSQLDPIYKNVLEFRHPSWWDSSVFKTCKSANVTICNVSGMNVPDDLIPNQTELYIRFHGNPTYEANYEEASLLEWAKRIKTLKLNNCWLYFNNTRLGNAPYNAVSFSNILK